VGGEIVIALASRCTNLDRLHENRLTHLTFGPDERRRLILPTFSPDQQRRFNLILERNRLYTAAKALAGSPFSVLFQFMEEAHRHENGLSAIFAILRNDGDDYFCNANNRAIE
jgi:hypothetical protein